MLGFIKRFLGDNNDKEIARYRKVVEKINALEPQMQALTDDKLTGYTNKFRERLANGETLDDILWAPCRRRRADRHVKVNAVVGQESLQQLPVAVGECPPHTADGVRDGCGRFGR